MSVNDAISSIGTNDAVSMAENPIDANVTVQTMEQQSDVKKEETPQAKYTEEDFTRLKSEHEAQMREAVVAAAAEEVKKALMKPEDKLEYEREQRERSLDEREKNAFLKELRLDALDMLAEKQLDKDFVDYVLGDDKESTMRRIEAFKPLFDKKVQAQVEVRLAGKTPPAGSPERGSGDAVRDQFRKGMGGF